LLACTAAPAFAADYLTEVTSEVYQTTGTPREIATRANTCISQHLAPGTVDAQLIISSDLDGGTIVARNAIDQGGLMRWQIRSRFAFEARDGRFRIEQTTLERFNQGRWGPIGKWTGSQWKGAEAAFKVSADAVAQCVMAPPRQSEW
jgi:hypothetical protein